MNTHMLTMITTRKPLGRAGHGMARQRLGKAGPNLGRAGQGTKWVGRPRSGLGCTRRPRHHRADLRPTSLRANGIVACRL